MAAAPLPQVRVLVTKELTDDYLSHRLVFFRADDDAGLRDELAAHGRQSRDFLAAYTYQFVEIQRLAFPGRPAAFGEEADTGPGHPGLLAALAALPTLEDEALHASRVVLVLPALRALPQPAANGVAAEILATMPEADRLALIADARRKKKARRLQIVRRYRLADVEPGTPSPWANYAAYLPEPARGAHDPNCLLNLLIGRYCTGGHRRLRPRRVLDFFREPGGVTIARLAEFAEALAFPLRVYDCLGRVVAEHSPEKKGYRRAGLAVVAYRNHAWPCAASVAASQPRRDPGVPFDPEGPGREGEPEELRAERAAFEGFIKASTPNFLYRAEEALKCQALAWDSLAGELAHEIDGRRAYYTNLAAAPADRPIGVFTCVDHWAAFAPAGRTSPAAYYLLRPGVVAGWRAGAVKAGLACARGNNLMHGWEVEAFRARGLLAAGDVEYEKRPSYTITTRALQELVSRVEDAAGFTPCAEGFTRFGKVFALYNGVLGRTRDTGRARELTLDRDDAELVEASHRDAHIAGEAPGGRCVVIVREEGRGFLPLNCVNLYNYVVACTSERLAAVFDGLPAEAQARLAVVRTDALKFTEGPEPPCPGDFKRVAAERINRKRYAWSPAEVSGRDVAALVGQEIERTAANVTGYQGPPGTGKSYTIKESKLARVALCFTNRAARTLTHEGADGEPVEGQTLHRRLRLFEPTELPAVCRELAGKVVWIDEFSQISPWIWSVIYLVAERSPLIVSGDRRQTPPLMYSGGGVCVDRLDYASPFLRALMRRLTPLTVDHRNDAYIVGLREVVDTAPSATLLAAVRAAVPPELDAANHPRDAVLAMPWHITFSNRYRAQLNAACLARRGLRFDPAALPFGRVDVGVRLCATASRARAGYFKGDLFEVTRAGARVALRRLPLAGGLQDGAPVEIEAAALRDFEAAFALTAFSSQGLTLEGGCVHQLAAMLGGGEFRELAYTAVTRFCGRENFLAHFGAYELPEPPAEPVRGHRGDEPEDRKVGDLVPCGRG